MNENIIKCSQDAIIATDLRGIITFCNTSASELLGFTETELLGKDYQTLTSPTDSVSFQEVKDFTLFNQPLPPYPCSVKTKNNKFEDVIVQYSGVKDKAGNLLGISSFLRKPSLFEKTASNAQALLETAPDSMIIVNDKGQIVFANNQTEDMFGYTSQELLGNKIEILIPEEYANHRGHRDKYMDNHKPRSMGQGSELFAKAKGGKKIPVEISLSPLETKDGLFVSAAIRDITDRKKIENRLATYNQELQVKNKDLEQFAFISSHDLHEPLRTVQGFIPLLKTEYENVLDDNGKMYINFIEEAVYRMSDSVNSLLEYSRIGRNVEVEKIDSNKLLDNVLKDLRGSIEDASADVSTGKLPSIEGNATEIRLVFQNILTNAIKFQKKDQKPEIKISAKTKGEFIEFTVTDNGIGIEEQFKEKIFIIFQRLHKRKNYSGSGIGLAHCRKIIELHGGKIWVSSEVGKGSSFHFTLPKK